MKAIWNWIVSIPKDKLLHDYAAALICLFSFAIAYRFLSLLWACFAIADGVAVLALCLKELYDCRHPEGYSVEAADILYGLFGLLKVNIALLIMLVR